MSCRDLPVSLTLFAPLCPSPPLTAPFYLSLPISALCPSLPLPSPTLGSRVCTTKPGDWIHTSTSPEVLSASSAHHFLKATREISLAVAPRYAAWCLWVERWDRHSVSAEESDVEDDGA